MFWRLLDSPSAMAHGSFYPHPHPHPESVSFFVPLVFFGVLVVGSFLFLNWTRREETHDG